MKAVLRKTFRILCAALFLLLGCESDGLARLSGVWRADIAASGKIRKLPADLEKDLKNLEITIDTQAGTMFLNWDDGTMKKHEFKVTSKKEDFYRINLAGKYDVEMHLKEGGVILMIEKENSLILRKAPDKK